jgi:rod shape-determining protein MreC
VGDAVVTSGLGCRFPAGLLVGRVVSVTRREFGLYQEVEISPSVNFSRLDEVLVMAVGDADRPNCRPTSARPRGNTPAPAPAPTTPAAAPARR